MDESWERLVETVSAFDAIDFAASIGALQLMPVNAERQLRLERAALLACSIPYEEDLPSISHSRVRSMLNDSPVAGGRIRSDEDPFEKAFTDSISFIGGSYVVLPGIAEEPVEVVRVLLRSIVLNGAGLPAEFVNETRTLAYAVLRLSDEIARRADLPRNLVAERDRRGELVVPPSAAFGALKTAVTFRDEELRELLRLVGLGALDSIVGEFGRTGLDPDDQIQLAYAYAKPVLRGGEQFIVVLPPGLMVALRHQIVVRAVELGIEDELATLFRRVANFEVERNLDRLGWGLAPNQHGDSPSWASESLWDFDTDKVANVIVVSDDLTDYSEDDPFDSWTSGLKPELDARVREVDSRIRADRGDLTAVLHLIVIQGIGRASLLGVALAASSLTEVLILSQPDLGVIARLESGDPLAVWKFAQARTRLRQRTRVLAFSVIDEFAAYRGARHSFYLTDDQPDVVSLSSDYGLDVRLEDIRRHDFHGVTHWESGAVTDVERLWSASGAPVYAPDPRGSERMELLIEHPEISIWVHQGDQDRSNGELRSMRFEFIDAIVYWLWEASDAISEVAEVLRDEFGFLRVEVVLTDPTSWGNLHEIDETAAWLDVNHGSGLITVTVRPAAQLALSGLDNTGEREMVRRLLTTIEGMAKEVGSGGFEAEIDALVDEIAPLGLKKKFMFLDVSLNVRLTPGVLPRVRTLQDADIELILDTAESVLEAMGISEGPIRDDHRNDVLNAIVAAHFDSFQEIVRGLDPQGLLQDLVRRHETIVRALAEQRLTLPTQLACFGAHGEYATEIQERLEDLEAADRSLRFVIEYVVAQPPSGSNPMSLATFDHLMALSNEIVNKGMLSDAVAYGLSDSKMGRLPSGRLAIDRDDLYIAGLLAFKPIKATQDFRAAHESFGDHWNRGRISDPPESLSALEEAAQEEWGLTMTELAWLVGELLRIGLEFAQEPSKMTEGELVGSLAAALEWSADKVLTGIESLSLRKRETFLPEDSPTDAYPWRFNRDPSYIRRPLLIGSEDGQSVVTWGVRHLDRVGLNLLQLIQGGRLKAKSSRMRGYMGEARQKEGEAFNDAVADAWVSRAPSSGDESRRLEGSDSSDLVANRLAMSTSCWPIPAISDWWLSRQRTSRSPEPPLNSATRLKIFWPAKTQPYGITWSGSFGYVNT